jgi:hypothetical protein
MLNKKIGYVSEWGHVTCLHYFTFNFSLYFSWMGFDYMKVIHDKSLYTNSIAQPIECTKHNVGPRKKTRICIRILDVKYVKNRNSAHISIHSISVSSLRYLCGCRFISTGSVVYSSGAGFDSRPHQIFWEVGDLERGPLSLMRTIEELLELESSGSGRGNSLRWSRNTLYQQRLALTSSASGGRSVGIVRLRTKATEFSFSFSRIISWSSG